MDRAIYDVVVIGAGAAGLTSAIYTCREGLKTCILEKGFSGGLTATTELVENYPGFPEGINGMDLMAKFKQQAERFGAELVESKEVTRITPSEGLIDVHIVDGLFRGRSVIIASGSIPKKLNLPGEKELKGKGVSYCATCDGPLFKGKDVAVVGCGNSGLQEGESLLGYAASVAFIEFLPEMTAQKILQDRVRKYEKAKFLLNHQLLSINGAQKVESVRVKNRATQEEFDLNVQGVFIYAGYLPNSGFLKGVVKLDKYGYVITDEHMKTSLAGAYAAGDIRSKEVRQIDVACGEATIAAISARDYLKDSLKNSRPGLRGVKGVV